MPASVLSLSKTERAKKGLMGVRPADRGDDGSGLKLRRDQALKKRADQKIGPETPLEFFIRQAVGGLPVRPRR